MCLFSAWDKADFLENCTLLGYYAAYRSMAKRWLNSKPRFCLRSLPTLAEEACGQLCPVGARPSRLHGLYKIQPLIGCSSFHVTNSIEFVHTLSSLWVGPEDLMVWFDIVSLLTQVPIVETLNLSCSCFSSHWFCTCSQWYGVNIISLVVFVKVGTKQETDRKATWFVCIYVCIYVCKTECL